MDATRQVITKYIVEGAGGIRAHMEEGISEAEALERFSRSKAKTKWGVKPRLVRETREVLAIKEDAPRA